MYYHSLPVICLSAHLEEVGEGVVKVASYRKVDRALRICLTLTRKNMQYVRVVTGKL